MREYELVVVIDPELEEEQLAAALDKIGQSVSVRGGEVVEVDRWGRRKLAYPIKGRTEGDYVINHIRLDPARAAELESSLRLSEEVLRHLLIRSDE
ncbi:MAG: 30S ribosomal protein S6 [Dehalococcoidia bacterium]|nr:30S ribosomal protein S6 [Dehalococcoidia bacterium]